MMTKPPLRFTPELLEPRIVAGLDVLTTLEHFAIVSYAVDVERVRPHVHERYDLDSFQINDGPPLVLVSIVCFKDLDFRFASIPMLAFCFGQTNYRTYVIDRESGNRAAWFFGTTLDSSLVAIPRWWWKLPWHPGRIRFDCDYDVDACRYRRYRMSTLSDWAAVDLSIEDSGSPIGQLEGWPDLEDGLVTLTHPLVGVYQRRDGVLGSYSVWHDRLHCTAGRINSASIALFDRLGIIPFAKQQAAHSVLIQRSTDFRIFLPPGNA